MSEHNTTTTTVTTQEQTAAAVVETPTVATEQPTAPTLTPDQLKAQQEAREAEAEQAREEAQEHAAASLKKSTAALRRAERDYKTGMLECGQYAELYIHQRISLLNHPRDNAVTTLAGQWAGEASYTVDVPFVNRVVGIWHAHRLLCVEAGISDKQATAVQYGAYKEGWVRLVERVNKGKAEECWVLLPGLEDKCRAAYKTAMENKLPVTGVLRDVQALVAEHAANLKAAADKQAAADAKAKQDADAKFREAEKVKWAAREVEQKAAAAELAVKQERERLEKAAKDAATEQERVRLAAEAKAAQLDEEKAAEVKRLAAADAKAKQDAAEKAAKDTQTTAAKATQSADAAKDAAKVADKAQDTAEKATAKAEGKKATTVAKTPEPQANAAPANLLTSGVDKSDSAMVASMAAELVTGCEAPDTTLLLLLQKLSDSGELSKGSKRALGMAIAAITAPAAAKKAS